MGLAGSGGYRLGGVFRKQTRTHRYSVAKRERGSAESYFRRKACVNYAVPRAGNNPALGITSGKQKICQLKLAAAAQNRADEVPAVCVPCGSSCASAA